MSIPIANPCEAEDPSQQGPTLFLMKAGAEEVYIWAHSFESAWEELVEYLDRSRLCAPFVTIGEAELKDAADTLGIDWDQDWVDNPSSLSIPQERAFEKVREYAEIDLTAVSHTQLSNCPNPAYIPSWEWGGGAITNPKIVANITRLSFGECHGHSFLVDDIVVWDERPGELFKINIVSGSNLDLESQTDGEFHVVEAEEVDWPPKPKRAPSMLPAFGPRGRIDDEEKRKQKDFFFPKSTLPKPRKGGGGLLGVKKKPKFGF